MIRYIILLLIGLCALSLSSASSRAASGLDAAEELLTKFELPDINISKPEGVDIAKSFAERHKGAADEIISNLDLPLEDAKALRDKVLSSSEEAQKFVAVASQSAEEIQGYITEVQGTISEVQGKIADIQNLVTEIKNLPQTIVNNAVDNAKNAALKALTANVDISLESAEEFLTNFDVADLNAAEAEKMLAKGGAIVDGLIAGSIDIDIAKVLADVDLSELKGLGQAGLDNINVFLENADIQEYLDKLPLEAFGQAVATIADIAGGAEAVAALASGEATAFISEAFQEYMPEKFAAFTENFGPETFAEVIEFGAAQQILASTFTALPGSFETFAPALLGLGIANDCDFGCASAVCQCAPQIQSNHDKIRKHVGDEFVKHRAWLIEELFTGQILPAMAQMTSQLSVVAVQQIQMIGGFFDAKHQLETQRLFQQLMAEAHKDYQPSEGVCVVGTNVRSLANSSRKSDLAQTAFARHALGRQLRHAGTASGTSITSDIFSRINFMTKNNCNKSDNSKGLNFLCAKSNAPKNRQNRDINFTDLVESKLTLDVDFLNTESTADEGDLFALNSNLFSHNLAPFIGRSTMATSEGIPREAATRYLDLRSVMAKRSVAQHSFASIIAERAKGDREVAPYLKKIVTDLGIPDADVDDILGEEPSYFAQMEVLTKNIYQNPVFYTELYDKPANVTRKGVTIRALNLMQERDFYNSQLRNEATLAIILETMLLEANRVTGDRLSRLEAIDD